MKDGFLKVASAAFEVTVGDVTKNVSRIKEKIDEAEGLGVRLLVLPELSLTGYTAMDLFSSALLLEKARDGLISLAAYTRGRALVAVVGLPFLEGGKVYNVAAVLSDGVVLGIVPKSVLCSRGAFAQGRAFASGKDIFGTVVLDGKAIPFGTDLVFAHESLCSFRFGVEIGSDSTLPAPPALSLTAKGASVIARVTATDASFGEAERETAMLAAASARYVCAYVSADASALESTQDLVYSAHHVITENGAVVAEAAPFSEAGALLITELDTALLYAERAKNDAYTATLDGRTVFFGGAPTQTVLTRPVSQNPFLPSNPDALAGALSHILNVQAHALAKRIAHAGTRTAILGISGGLDSTLALLVMTRAYDILKRPHGEILAVTMPGFGTSERTYRNAVGMCNALGVRLREISIAAAVTQHFADIGQDINTHDVTYENAQARERTQILMDIANMEGGLVVGTGDISEMALGWATYNGDHMSMYAVNASVTKTMVRALVRYEAQHASSELAAVLFDILGTPVSPELLPTDKEGKIAQKTEDLVGPYALHDFFLYYTVRYGFSPRKIYRLARHAFGEEYTGEEILKWLRVFARRFFTQQFKRSCMPDGPKTGAISLSPRGAWQMPSDASSALWLSEIDSIVLD